MPRACLAPSSVSPSLLVPLVLLLDPLARSSIERIFSGAWLQLRAGPASFHGFTLSMASCTSALVTAANSISSTSNTNTRAIAFRIRSVRFCVLKSHTIPLRYRPSQIRILGKIRNTMLKTFHLTGILPTLNCKSIWSRSSVSKVNHLPSIAPRLSSGVGSCQMRRNISMLCLASLNIWTANVNRHVFRRREDTSPPAEHRHQFKGTRLEFDCLYIEQHAWHLPCPQVDSLQPPHGLQMPSQLSQGATWSGRSW
mmetsp:Transcript_16300/g.47692  ORF Transcript_16300/g.47692 Transcript_16300/m.47692 type:complete len:254 (+) Transcript_16300:346-1107(+)